jgi:hypothetical protein
MSMIDFFIDLFSKPASQGYVIFLFVVVHTFVHAVSGWPKDKSDKSKPSNL